MDFVQHALQDCPEILSSPLRKKIKKLKNLKGKEGCVWACVCEREGSGVERELSSAIMNGLCASVRRGGGKVGVRIGGGGECKGK